MFLRSPATAPENCLDDVKPHVRWETPRGRYDVVQQQFSLSKKPRLSIQEELESAQKVVSCKCGATKQEGRQSPRLVEKQRIKRMVWKMNVNAKKWTVSK